MNDGKKILRPNNIILQDRKNLSISGVENVDSFTDSNIILLTSAGNMSIEGTDLHIVKLSVDTGDLFIEGFITGIFYIEAIERPTGNFFSRIFK